MPTYEYSCKHCGYQFEEFQSITAGPLRKCPKCGKLKLKRLIGSGAGVIFKGSGFYQTDYRSDSYHKASQADKPGTAASKKSDTASKSGKTKGASTSAKEKA